jgi:hypothetical protein
MPRYRIFYADHGPAADDAFSPGYDDVDNDVEEVEDEWEETFEAKDPASALKQFFHEHTPRNKGLRMIEEDGSARVVDTWEDFDPDRTFVWVEEDRLMEYQGLQEATPGMVACPLCDGAGEVEEDVAEDFVEKWHAPEEHDPV